MMNYLILLVIVLIIVLLLCSKKENFSYIGNCKCSLCHDKKIIDGICFDTQKDCEKVCSDVYNDIGVGADYKGKNKCKYDQDRTYTCYIPEWASRHIPS
jgi:hypothetical protein